jgi:hypothetical protein
MDDPFKSVKDLDDAFNGVEDEGLFEGLVDFDGVLDGSRDWISEDADKNEGSSSKGWI